MDFEWRVVVQNQDLIWAGMVMTVVIATISFVLSLGLGLVISLFRLSRIKLISLLAAGYINLFRAIPQLVFIVYIYYGVSIAIGINFSPIMAGVIALTLQYSAWLAEIFRSGIQAVSPGQREAALAVGMSRIGAFVTITLPQAFRIVIPPTGNTAVGIIKDSSLVAVIGVFELLRRTQLLVSQTFRPFEFYTAAVVAYLSLTMAVAVGVKLIERRYALVDPLSESRRRLGPLARRRLRRLEALQATVLRETVAS